MARSGDASASIAHGCQENVSQSLLGSSSGQAGKQTRNYKLLLIVDHILIRLELTTRKLRR